MLSVRSSFFFYVKLHNLHKITISNFVFIIINILSYRLSTVLNLKLYLFFTTFIWPKRKIVIFDQKQFQNENTCSINILQ